MRNNTEKTCDVMRKKSFTLVEMLVVLAIIAALLGMLLPVLGRVREHAKRAKARDAVNQLATAWQGYLTDYRMFPSTGDDPANPVIIREMNTNMMNILAGRSYYNTRGSNEFMEFTTNEFVIGFLDPWGSLYQVRLDNGRLSDSTPYDGRVNVPQESAELNRSVAVWSRGPDRMDDAVNRKGDDIKSWE
ncbi:MAG: type II secretion system protein [Kiritimatiellae bacterium]|nr:type II secretion system protein [Kiritimatiellia bacterium]MDD5522258.1 type II secretion system protein [Kiritimatiellia bacterium]